MIKEFTLGATKWDVEEVDKLNSTTQLGECSLGQSKISISKTWANEKVSDQSKEATLYHEVTHAILDTLGYHEHSNDELLVQGLATLFQQFEKTKK